MIRSEESSLSSPSSIIKLCDKISNEKDLNSDEGGSKLYLPSLLSS
ncbi:hypothetical protein [Wolbachia endosymbiont of Brugia malayi]|nr:hypothetical protein [Wolbachia endosymbiont of Brugia malayi]